MGYRADRNIRTPNPFDRSSRWKRAYEVLLDRSPIVDHSSGMTTALIVSGGWRGHTPQALAEKLAGWLRDLDFEVELSDSLDAFLSLDDQPRDLIVPNWTMGEISGEQRDAVSRAVAAGSGLAGCHGGMGDAFRNDPAWQFLTGGQFVAHPGGNGVRYTVHVGPSGNHAPHWITDGIDDFALESEQYYLHVDPAIRVLASTIVPPPEMEDDDATVRAHHDLFGPHTSNNPVRMPVAWTKMWGEGRVFYCSIGHDPALFDLEPLQRLMLRGMAWAARQESVIDRMEESIGAGAR